MNAKTKMEAGKEVFEEYLFKSKRVSTEADPLLTNPLNSCTKLQISAT